MTTSPRPDPNHISPSARTRRWPLVLVGFAAGVAVAVPATFLLNPKPPTLIQARGIASGEHESQVTILPPSAVPAPEAAPAPAPAALPHTEPTPTGTAFVDRFDSSNFADRWFISDGWSNGPWMVNDWRKAAVGTEKGLVTLNLQPAPQGSGHEMMGAEIRTHEFYRYGYFEVKMRVPKGAGTVTGVFSYAHPANGVTSNEIDIEILGKNTRAAELTIHENGRSTSKVVTLPFDSSEGFHSYGFDWQPGYVRWYVDGVLAHEETGQAARNLVRPQQLIMDLWGSRQLEAWVGPLDTKQGPWKLDFSCVAYAKTYAAPLCN